MKTTRNEKRRTEQAKSTRLMPLKVYPLMGPSPRDNPHYVVAQVSVYSFLLSCLSSDSPSPVTSLDERHNSADILHIYIYIGLGFFVSTTRSLRGHAAMHSNHTGFFFFSRSFLPFFHVLTEELPMHSNHTCFFNVLTTPFSAFSEEMPSIPTTFFTASAEKAKKEKERKKKKRKEKKRKLYHTNPYTAYNSRPTPFFPS